MIYVLTVFISFFGILWFMRVPKYKKTPADYPSEGYTYSRIQYPLIVYISAFIISLIPILNMIIFFIVAIFAVMKLIDEKIPLVESVGNGVLTKIIAFFMQKF